MLGVVGRRMPLATGTCAPGRRREPPRAATVAATVAALSVSPSLPLYLLFMNVTKSLAAVALVAALFVAWRAVAQPDDAPTTLGETEAVTLQPSARDGLDREVPCKSPTPAHREHRSRTPESQRSKSGNATLRVRVVDEDGVDVHRAHVVVDIDGEERGGTKVRAVAETDRDGYWSDNVPAGKALVVSVGRDDTSPGKSHAHRDRLRHDVRGHRPVLLGLTSTSCSRSSTPRHRRRSVERGCSSSP